MVVTCMCLLLPSEVGSAAAIGTCRREGGGSRGGSKNWEMAEGVLETRPVHAYISGCEAGAITVHA